MNITKELMSGEEVKEVVGCYMNNRNKQNIKERCLP